MKSYGDRQLAKGRSLWYSSVFLTAASIESCHTHSLSSIPQSQEATPADFCQILMGKVGFLFHKYSEETKNYANNYGYEMS